MLGKKMKRKHIGIAALVCVFAILLPVLIVRAGPWTTQDMVDYMYNIGRHKIWRTNYIVKNEIKPQVDNIWALTGNTHRWANIIEAFDDIKNEIMGIEEDVQATYEKMGQGLVGENHEESITLDGGFQYLLEIPSEDVRENPKKITLYIDLGDMGAGDTVDVWLVYDADYDDSVLISPRWDAPEDALTGAAYDFTWSGNQAYDVKLVFKQLPISEWFLVYIYGTSGLVVPYHWILEEV